MRKRNKNRNKFKDKFRGHLNAGGDELLFPENDFSSISVDAYVISCRAEQSGASENRSE